MAEMKPATGSGIWCASAKRAGHPTLEVSAFFVSQPSEEYMAQRLLAMVYLAETAAPFVVDREAAASLQLAGFGYAMSPIERVVE